MPNLSQSIFLYCSRLQQYTRRGQQEQTRGRRCERPQRAKQATSARSSSSRRTCTPASPPQAPFCCTNSTTTAAREVFDNSAKSVNVAANSYNVTSNNIGFEVLRGDEGLLHLGQARRVQQERQHQDNRRSGGEMDMAGGSGKAGCSGRWRSGVFL